MNTKLDSHRLDEMDNTKLSPLDTFPKPEGSGQSPCQLQSWPQPSGSSWSSLDFPEVCSSAHKLSCCQRPLAVHFQGCVCKFWHHISSFLKILGKRLLFYYFLNRNLLFFRKMFVKTIKIPWFQRDIV